MHVSVCMYQYTHTHTHTYIYIYMYIHTNTLDSTYYVCVYQYIHIYIYIYILIHFQYCTLATTYACKWLLGYVCLTQSYRLLCGLCTSICTLYINGSYTDTYTLLINKSILGYIHFTHKWFI